MIDILKILPVQSENPENVVNLATVQVISVASLTSFLQNKSEPVDNTPLLCPHQKLSPSMVRSCKYISTEGAAKLFDHLSGGPQLFLLESICHECVQAKCEFLRVKKKTGDDAKEIQSMLKMKLDVSKPTFWVGKNSLKYWKSLVNKDLAMKKITNGVDSPSYNENNSLNQAGNGIANVQSDDEKKQLSPISSSSDKNVQSSPLKSNSQSNNMLDTLAYNLFIDRRSNKECETNGDSIEDSVSESEVDKNSNGFRKRLLDCRHVEDEQLERTKRIRTSDRRVPSCNSSNDALQEINCNNTNTSCNNKNTIHPKDSLNSDQVNNTGKNIKETKSSFVISPEMTECYVLMENLETTFNLFKSKFLCVLKQQQNQQQKENPCDKIKNLQCTRVSPQGDNDIDEHFVGPDDVNSEQILTSKIEFNTYVKSESLDESFNRNNHLHINLESQEGNVTSIEATSIMNSKLELNHVDKDLNGGQGTSLDNGGVSSPLKSYSNSIERVLEQNKKGTVKSPDLTKCEEDNDNEVETFRRNRTYDHNSCTKSTRTNQSKNEGLLYEDKAHSRFDDKQNDQVNGDNERRKRKMKDGDNDGEEDEESTDENTQKEFNEDILCPHGELIPDESMRRLVPQGVWSILSTYFPLARAFPHDAETCKKCEHRNLQDEVTKEENRRTAALHREKFAHLLNSKNRPSLASLVEEVQNMGPSDDNDLGNSRKLYMISREFLDTWKRFVRDSTKRDVPRELCNASLLCDHGKLLYEPELEYSADDNPVFVWVSEEEWSQLKAVFQVDYELSTFYCATVRTFINTPDICEACVTKRKASEEQEQLTYTRGKLVIRVANSDDSAPEDSAGKKTDEWSMNGKSSKGHISNKSSSSDDVSVIANGSNAETTVRRSQRKRKAKNDVILTVSSSDTLMSVKVKILKRLCIAPYDQNLFLLETGRLLEENSATLQQLNVHRDSVILLKVS
ncbi:hypothetical protein M8J77_000039 [Diaphorina citri]|nr:hypothetical protein M8J77_000039 [Diaphorina citri]